MKNKSIEHKGAGIYNLRFNESCKIVFVLKSQKPNLNQFLYEKYKCMTKKTKVFNLRVLKVHHSFILW